LLLDEFPLDGISRENANHSTKSLGLLTLQLLSQWQSIVNVLLNGRLANECQALHLIY